MQHFTYQQIRSVEETTDRLCSVAFSLTDRDSKKYKDAVALSEIICRLRQAADVMQYDPEGAERLMMSLIRPLQTTTA
jgi:response regulator RpfG family c-di-GMP phosphodiesterase